MSYTGALLFSLGKKSYTFWNKKYSHYTEKNVQRRLLRITTPKTPETNDRRNSRIIIKCSGKTIIVYRINFAADIPHETMLMQLHVNSILRRYRITSISTHLTRELNGRLKDLPDQLQKIFSDSDLSVE